MRPRANVTVNGEYTLQLRNHGTFVGESRGVPGHSSVFGDFPEVFGPALDRLAPDGRLDSYQRHKLRVYAVVSRTLGQFGTLDVAPLLRVNSGAAYSLVANIPIPAVQLARIPGAPDKPAYPVNDLNPFVRRAVFFGERGAQTFAGYGLLDLAVTYRIAAWKSLTPWFKLELYNLMNNQKPIAWDTTISANRSGALDANGIPTTYTEGARFGQATSDLHYPVPFAGQAGGRAMRLAFGLRF